MYRSTDLSFQKICQSLVGYRCCCWNQISSYTKLMVQMTSVKPLCGLHIPHAPHLITGAYGAMSKCSIKPEVTCNHATSPKNAKRG